MADLSSSQSTRTRRLVLLSYCLLPLTVCLVAWNYMIMFIGPQGVAGDDQRWKSRKQHGFREYTILVTGVGMAKGLTIARAFYLCGHKVIGADFEEEAIACPGRFSRALARFYPLGSALSRPHNYKETLLALVWQENVDLWVSCSGVASALDDAEAMEMIQARTRCKCIQLDVGTTAMLHEKDAFMQQCRNLSLPIPDTFHVVAPEQVRRVLAKVSVERLQDRFILKPVGVNDAFRADMTLLPLHTSEATAAHINKLPISKENPWILQRYIKGGKEYCTHALVVKGEVKVFVACPSSELLMHYRALPWDSPDTQAMLEFTKQFLKRSSAVEWSWTGHLSFDFMAEEVATDDGREKVFYAIECNPRAHTAVVLFAQPGPEMRNMVQAYLSAIDGETFPKTNGTAYSVDAVSPIVHPPRNALPRYWLGHDLVTKAIFPFLHLASRSHSSDLRDLVDFSSHLLFWKEGTYEPWDPMPFQELYHVYWPRTLQLALYQGRNWSRVNVSTTKMFLSA